MTSKLIIVALSTVLIAAPVSAKGTEGEGKADKAASVDTKKYCIQYDNVVGTRVARTQCLTKEEWKKQHVDVDRMLNQ